MAESKVQIKGDSSNAQSALQGLNKKLLDMKPNLDGVSSLLSDLGNGFLGVAGNALSSAKDQHSIAIIHLITS